MSKLARVLEPEAMDSALEAAEYDAMDHAAVNGRFVDDFLAAFDRTLPTARRPHSVLDLGTGTAQIPIELCRQRTEFQIVAVDLSAEMLKLARHNVERRGLTARIECRLADAKRAPWQDDEFAAVISNSIVHHVAEPWRVLAQAVRVCRPGGLVFFRDLLRPDDLDQLQWLVDAYAAGANGHQRSLLAASLHAALTLDEMRRLVADLGLPPETVAQSSDRHWTWTAVRTADK